MSQATESLFAENHEHFFNSIGHKQTWLKDGVMSALPPKADIDRRARHVRLVPILLQKSFCTGDQKFSGL